MVTYTAGPGGRGASTGIAARVGAALMAAHPGRGVAAR